ncbi:MAG: hypothetical protein ACRDGM_05805, partial [bacterium]
LRAQPGRSRLFNALGLLLIACFSISRIDPGVFGASDRIAMVHHSIPRYWSPVYLLAALPPILFMGYCRKRVVVAIGATTLCALAVSGAYEIYLGQLSSFRPLRHFTRDNERLILSLGTTIPADAMVYSSTYDKVLWSRWRVGTLGEPEPTAMSIRRALDARVAVFIFEPRLGGNQYRRLAEALKRQHFALIATGSTRELYRVEREP